MNEKELLDFIEKLFANFKDDEICFDCEIEKLDKSKMNNHTLLYNKCIDEKLLYELSITSDKLTERGKDLKRLKTFDELDKFEKPKISEPSFFTKHKDLLWFTSTIIIIILMSIPIYLNSTKIDLKKVETIPSLHPKDSILKKSDTITKNMR